MLSDFTDANYDGVGEAYYNGDALPDAYAYDTDGINGWDSFLLNTNPDEDNTFETGVFVPDYGSHYFVISPYEPGGAWYPA